MMLALFQNRLQPLQMFSTLLRKYFGRANTVCLAAKVGPHAWNFRMIGLDSTGEKPKGSLAEYCRLSRDRISLGLETRLRH